MFTIEVGIERYSVTGIEALDARRRLCLPDGNSLCASLTPVETEVSEAFARVYFKKSATRCRQNVPVSLLVPSDVEEDGITVDGPPWMQLRSSLAGDRIRELFLAGRNEELKNLVLQLETELKALKK
jgi:hypothetical protein